MSRYLTYLSRHCNQTVKLYYTYIILTYSEVIIVKISQVLESFKELIITSKVQLRSNKEDYYLKD